MNVVPKKRLPYGRAKALQSLFFVYNPQISGYEYRKFRSLFTRQPIEIYENAAERPRAAAAVSVSALSALSFPWAEARGNFDLEYVDFCLTSCSLPPKEKGEKKRRETSPDPY